MKGVVSSEMGKGVRAMVRGRRVRSHRRRKAKTIGMRDRTAQDTWAPGGSRHGGAGGTWACVGYAPGGATRRSLARPGS